MKYGEGDMSLLKSVFFIVDTDFYIDNFENIRTVHFYNPDWEARAEQAREWARVHYWNTIKQIEVTLKAIK